MTIVSVMVTDFRNCCLFFLNLLTFLNSLTSLDYINYINYINYILFIESLNFKKT